MVGNRAAAARLELQGQQGFGANRSDFSQSEIARSLNISCNYVGYLLNNGLRRLRKLIEADELRDAHLRFSYAPRRVAGQTPATRHDANR